MMAVRFVLEKCQLIVLQSLLQTYMECALCTCFRVFQIEAVRLVLEIASLLFVSGCFKVKR
jgi:hypothetical protein